ncbi:MAG: sugar phosphate isomerase/epimerase [Pirellulales bacterium]|nr:sugar phosphate isomerase/epimerase [Pirellulales bacterium]
MFKISKYSHVRFNLILLPALFVLCHGAWSLAAAAGNGETNKGADSTASISSAKKEKIPVGIQLYAVRGAFAKDVTGTLRKLAEMGYEGVEFWGYGGGPNVFKNWTAERLRKELDRVGLKCCGMHLKTETLIGDAFNRTVEINKVLGNKYLIIAADRKRMSSPEAIGQFAKLLNDAARRAKKLGMRVGYHSHGFDMKQFDGRTAWEILFSQTTPDVIMQLDTGNCAYGGGNPKSILKQFPNRATTLHLKEYQGATLTADNRHFLEIFRLAETSQGTRWYIVEQGDGKGLDFDVPRKALEGIRRMGRGNK